MAEVVVSLVLESLKASSVLRSLKELINRKAALTGAEEIVMWMEDELGWMMPQFARIEAQPQLPHHPHHLHHNEDLIGRITDVIRRAEDLIDTYTKSVTKAAKCKKLIYLFKLRRINKELHIIKDEIAQLGDELSQSVEHVLPSSDSVEQNLPESGDVLPGLVHPKKYGNESVEHVAERYLNELIDLKVVCVTKTKHNGKVKACQLKDDTRDIWLKTAQEDKFLQNRRGNIRRLVDHNGSTDDSCFIRIHGNPSISRSVPNSRGLISFLSFNTREGSKPGEDIGDFLRKYISAKCFEWLRVLDLERVFRPKLPKTLGKLIGLRWTYLENLPKFVNMLFNLQALDVKHTYISVLPRSIWSMQYLRHLYLSEAYRTKFPYQPSAISLTSPQTLWGAFIPEDTCEKEGLDTLLNIRKLGLSCRTKPSKNAEMSEQLKAVNKWISNLRFIASLRLKSRDARGEPADLHLSSLERNRNLSTVYLLGKLDPHVICEFPVSLTDITLSGSQLELDPMEFLCRLPNLVILRLLAQSVVHNKMHCSRRGFRQLKLLHIWKLENLEEWEAEEGSLPSLEELEIRSCKKLKKCPGGRQHFSTLQKFRLTSMPVEFIYEIKKNQCHWDKIEPVLEVN